METNKNGTIHDVENIIIHDNYAYDNDNDIALLRVKEPFTEIKIKGTLPQENLQLKSNIISILGLLFLFNS